MDRDRIMTIHSYKRSNLVYTIMFLLCYLENNLLPRKPLSIPISRCLNVLNTLCYNRENNLLPRGPLLTSISRWSLQIQSIKSEKKQKRYMLLAMPKISVCKFILVNCNHLLTSICLAAHIPNANLINAWHLIMVM